MSVLSRALRVLPLVLSTFCTSALGEDLPAGLQGLWRVADSACSGCDPAQGPETGAEVRLGRQGYQNPFASDCQQAVGVERLPGESVAALQARLGLPARWLPEAAQRAPAESFRLLCGGERQAWVLLLANGELLLPTEASTVLRLVRSAAGAP